MPPFNHDKPIVLFLCTGNSARSQMAEAFLRIHAGDRFEARSAGLEPKGVHPLTIRVMEEVGISLEGQHSKSLTEFLGKVAVRYVIFVCENAEQSCPRVWPFALKSFCMPFPDPAAATGTQEERLQAFRDVRDQIEQQILEWIQAEPYTSRESGISPAPPQ